MRPHFQMAIEEDAVGLHAAAVTVGDDSIAAFSLGLRGCQPVIQRTAVVIYAPTATALQKAESLRGSSDFIEPEEGVLHSAPFRVEVAAVSAVRNPVDIFQFCVSRVNPAVHLFRERFRTEGTAEHKLRGFHIPREVGISVKCLIREPFPDAGIVVRHPVIVEIRRILRRGESKCLHRVAAAEPPRLRPRPLQGGKQNRCENCNDCNYNK